jgi:transcriptional regulator with XRE-family HTH domain
MISDREGQGEFARALTQSLSVGMLAGTFSVGTFSAGTLAGGRSGPTVLRIALGTQLRRLREASNLTTAQAAEAIRATHSKISRLERGRSAARPRDVADLLSLYGVTDEAEREKLLALARAASAPGWWQQYSDVLPRWLELYIGLEKAASVIRTYEVQFVHGLMQTEDYARAVILISNARASAEEIERRVSLRMQRQQLLTQPDAPELWAVLDEAALRRSPAGPDVMRAQLKHLLQLTDLPNVTLQIVPFDVGPHAAAGGPFTILRFPEPDLPDVVYLEQLNSALYLDQPEDVTDYVTVMDQLCVQAATGTASKNMLSALLAQTPRPE